MRNQISTFIAQSMCCLFFSSASLAQKTETQYLSGTGSEDTVEWDFYCTKGMNSGSWQKIQVPSCWEQQGFGAYNYGHDEFEDRLNEEGWYKYNFQVDKTWRGKHVAIVFDGVMTDCEVKINGKLAGDIHQGAFYQFKYNVGKLLKYDAENLLEVKVKKHSDNPSVSYAERKADYWVFGGIFRPVYLEMKPKQHIERYAVDAKADGSFTADVYFKGLKTANRIATTILDQEGNKKAKFTTKITSVKDRSVRVTGNLNSPKLWSPEFPNLYKVVFELLNKDGGILHSASGKIGFRTVEVRAHDGVYVNDERIKFKGVNRHTFHPEHARTSSKSLSIEAVNLIKDMNMNAVRMSHYPPDSHFLEACDSLGLFVLNELSGWNVPYYDINVGRKLLKEMVLRDVNHPSVVIWDNGNEKGWNPEIDDDFAKYDIQKREVIHPEAAFRKTMTGHYIHYNFLSMDYFTPRTIFFPTEFLHGLYDGGHGAGLEDYWHRMWNQPLCAGGFLWVFADEALKRTDTGMLDSAGNYAPDGIVGPYNEKEGSFYAIKEIWSPVFFENRYVTNEFNGIFNIENRFHYTNLDQCTFKFSWVELKFSNEEENVIIEEGVPNVQNLVPNQKGTLKVGLPNGWQNADVLYVEATDPHGRSIYKWSWPVKQPAHVAPNMNTQKSKEKVTVIDESKLFITLSASDVEVTFNKASGTLKAVKNAEGEIPFTGGPINVSAPNEEGGTEHYQEGSDYVVETFSKDKKMHYKWIVRPNGMMDLEVDYQPKSTGANPLGHDFVGISFNYPESNIAGVKWMGDGPYRVWKNRRKGVTFNIWEKQYNNTITGQSYEYPEFKGYHSSLYWAEFKGKESPDFKVFCRTNDIYLRLFSPEEAEQPSRTTVEHPVGDISFLHGIPAIGTKMKYADKLGPQSQPYIFWATKNYNRRLSMSLTFDFGAEQKSKP